MDRDQVVYLDTHVLVRLYLGQADELSEKSRTAINDYPIYASPASILELEYLHEIGRLRPAAARVMGVLNQSLGLLICDLPFRVIANHAVAQKWTRDPFDRLIVGNAKARNAQLVTKDEQIRRYYPGAIW